MAMVPMDCVLVWQHHMNSDKKKLTPPRVVLMALNVMEMMNGVSYRVSKSSWSNHEHVSSLRRGLWRLKSPMPTLLL